MKAHVALQNWWTRTGAGIHTQIIPADRVSRLEERYEVRLPEDFKDYLSLSSPVGEAIDNEVTTWWDFDRIKNIPDEYPHKLGPAICDQAEKFLFFADHLFWCWAWAISCAEDKNKGRIALVGGQSHDRFVAESFSDFVSRYVRDFRSVC